MRRVVWVVAILYWTGSFVMTHLPSRHVPGVPVSDKLEHFLGYGLLGGMLFAAMWLSGVRNVGMKVLAILLLYGMIDEWTQALPFIDRSCEFMDWCADAAGAGVAVVIGSGVAWWLGDVRSARAVEPVAGREIG